MSSKDLHEIDEASAGFIHMIVERQESCEKQIAAIKLNSQVPDLFLDPCSAYRRFNDGYRLEWILFDKISLRTSQNVQCSIDEVHLDAIVYKHGIVMKLPIIKDRLFYIGHPCRFLILRDFIKQVESIMIDEEMPGNRSQRTAWRTVKGKYEYYRVWQNKDIFHLDFF